MTSTCTLQDAWNLYTETKISKEANIKKEESRFNTHIFQYWGNIELSSIKTRDILIFRKNLFQKNLSPKTVRNTMSLLRALFNRAKKYELYEGYVPYFEMPLVNNSRTRFLSEFEAQILLNSLYHKSKLWHDISLFALNTGMRAGEIFSLKPSAINIHQQLVTIHETKNGTTRVLPLNRTALEISKKYLVKEQSYLFSKIQINSVSKKFRQSVKEVGLNKNITNNKDKIVFHSLRHTFASWLVQRGTPLLVVSQLLGHKDLTMTMRYAHLAPDQCANAVSQLPYNLSSVN